MSRTDLFQMKTDLFAAIDYYHPESAELLTSFGYAREPDVTVEVWRHPIPARPSRYRQHATPSHTVWVCAAHADEDTTAAVVFQECPTFHLGRFSIGVELSMNLPRLAFRSQSLLDRLGGAVEDVLTPRSTNSPSATEPPDHIPIAEMTLRTVRGLGTPLFEVVSGTTSTTSGRTRLPDLHVELPSGSSDSRWEINSAAGSLWMHRTTGHQIERHEYHRAGEIHRDQFVELVQLTLNGVPFDWAVAATIPDAGPSRIW